MWDIVISRDMLRGREDQLRKVLAGAVARRLPEGKQLVRVVGWSPNAGCLFTPQAGVDRYAVAYLVRSAA
jgi:hypothetical protein